jgi:hypothetical protein
MLFINHLIELKVAQSIIPTDKAKIRKFLVFNFKMKYNESRSLFARAVFERSLKNIKIVYLLYGRGAVQ